MLTIERYIQYVERYSNPVTGPVVAQSGIEV
jgi:hypothetical protein